MSRERAIAAIVGLGLGAAAAAAYAPTTSFPFVGYDDGARLLGNPPVRSGLSWENLKWAFSSEWDANWSPVTWLSHMLDFTFYGADAGGHHLTNVILHAMNAVLLFGALRSATGDTLRPAAVALLLALHPIHVESVAWVSERKGLLSSGFAFASLWAYVAHTRSGRPSRRSLALVLLALGLMAKPMLVSLPFLFLLLDHWPLSRVEPGAPAGRLRSLVALALEKTPYLALVAASVAVTLLAQERGGALRAADALPLLPRLANAVVSSALYLEMLVWPRDLAALYPHPNLPGGTPWTLLQVIGAASLLAALGAVAWRARHPALRIGLLWYAVALLPVIGVVQVGSQMMADRYAYLPAVGIYLGVVYAAAEWLRGRPPMLRAAGVAVFCALLLAFAWQGQQQIGVWRSSETLFRHAVGVTRANYAMHFNLANTLKARGRIEEAIGEYRAALEIWPGMERAHFNLANTLAAENRVDEAIHHYRAAAEARPDSIRARDALGRMLVRKRDLPGAIAHYRAEASRRPNTLAVQVTLAHLLRLDGEFAEAIRAYEAAARLAPEDPRWLAEVEATRAQRRGEATTQPTLAPQDMAPARRTGP